jgi:hypothetical protein
MYSEEERCRHSDYLQSQNGTEKRGKLFVVFLLNLFKFLKTNSYYDSADATMPRRGLKMEANLFRLLHLKLY